MKRVFYIFILSLLYGCPVYDPPRGSFEIWNDSDEAIYVHFNCGNIDSLPSYPKLELFLYFSNDNIIDAHGNTFKSRFVSPEYRINAYYFSSIYIWGSPEKPRLPCKEDEATLFFITEKTMRNYDWEEIYKNQMYVKKILLTKEELENSDWKYTYSSDSTNILMRD